MKEGPGLQQCRRAFDVGEAEGLEAKELGHREPSVLTLMKSESRIRAQGSTPSPLAFTEDVARVARTPSSRRGPVRENPVAFRWCKEAKEEFLAAVGRPGGSILKGETLHVLKKMVSGALDVAETHKIIRQTAVHGEIALDDLVLRRRWRLHWFAVFPVAGESTASVGV